METTPLPAHINFLFQKPDNGINGSPNFIKCTLVQTTEILLPHHVMSLAMFHIISTIPVLPLSLSLLVNIFPLSTPSAHTYHIIPFLLLSTIHDALQYCYSSMYRQIHPPSKIQALEIWTLEIFLNCLPIYHKLLYHYYMGLKSQERSSKHHHGKKSGGGCLRGHHHPSLSQPSLLD